MSRLPSRCLLAASLLMPDRALPGQRSGADPVEVQKSVDQTSRFLKTTQGEDGVFSPKARGPGITPHW